MNLAMQDRDSAIDQPWASLSEVIGTDHIDRNVQRWGLALLLVLLW